MTKKEFSMIANAMRTYYPREKILPNEQSMELWYNQLKDIPYDLAEKALNKWVATNKWSPSISDIRNTVSEDSAKKDMLSELDAWAQTRLAIRDSSYHAEERFDELPEICQRIVESPENLRKWALMDSETLESVVMSQFLRNHRLIKERMRQEQSAPEYFPKIERHETPMIEDKVDVEQEMSRGIPMPDGMMEDVRKRFRRKE